MAGIKKRFGDTTDLTVLLFSRSRRLEKPLITTMRAQPLFLEPKETDVANDLTRNAVDQMFENAIVSRHLAAEVLMRVAVDGAYGSFPPDVTCEQLGEALHRLCLNSTESNPLEGIVRGWRGCEA